MDNRIEEIKEDVDFAQTWFDNMPEGEPICQDELDTVKDILGHVRYLLEKYKQQQVEIERLSADREFWVNLYNQERDLCKGQKENLREINERIYADAERLLRELEQLKAERDKYQSALHAEQKENVRLMEELAAKDKVLEWYADESAEIARAYYFGQTKLAIGERARYILKRYERGDNTDGDVSQASSDLG